MALTYTPEAKAGDACPDFSLPTVDGKRLSLKDCADAKALVVMFICNHCPYVQAIEERLLTLARETQKLGAKFVAICSNDFTEYPEDSPAELLKRWESKSYPFPYLLDEDQSVAKKFGAVCTPDLFVYDGARKLAYRGRLDDSWRDPQKVKRQELKEAIMTVLGGKPFTATQNPSMGCSIKWKNGD